MAQRVRHRHPHPHGTHRPRAHRKRDCGFHWRGLAHVPGLARLGGVRAVMLQWPPQPRVRELMLQRVLRDARNRRGLPPGARSQPREKADTGTCLRCCDFRSSQRRGQRRRCFGRGNNFRFGFEEEKVASRGRRASSRSRAMRRDRKCVAEEIQVGGAFDLRERGSHGKGGFQEAAPFFGKTGLHCTSRRHDAEHHTEGRRCRSLRHPHPPTICVRELKFPIFGIFC
mmetsp:Transcript_12202/g.22608  ORF Transcript_12202/g.22608 Transcript_12202/m.22608 type:complete len:227 (+) Transcript_12202:333-1013(+)